MEQTLAQALFFGAIGLVLGLVLLRVTLSIDRQLKNQKAMIGLLIKLCRKQGVSEDEIDGLKNTFEIK